MQERYKVGAGSHSNHSSVAPRICLKGKRAGEETSVSDVHKLQDPHFRAILNYPRGVGPSSAHSVTRGFVSKALLVTLIKC